MPEAGAGAGPVSDLAGMLAAMAPMLDAEPYRFVVSDFQRNFAAHADSIFAVIHEDEGSTFIMRAAPGEEDAQFARITLMIHSALDGVGLTAAVSRALAEAGIACNVVAGFHHDHLFVPWERRGEALATLQRLSKQADR